MLGMILTGVGFATDFRWSRILIDVGVALIVPFGLFGAKAAVAGVFTGNKIRCPFCNSIGELVICGPRQPGVRCPNCGLVYARDVLVSFRIDQVRGDGES